MPKRMTSSDKWDKKWIRLLDPKYKLFWVYILDKCNHAGIWEVDLDHAEFQLGIEYDEKELIETFKRKIVPIKNGVKWFIPKFIEFQYGQLNENVNPHKPVIALLRKYNLLGTLKIGLINPKIDAKEQDKEKAKDKGKEKKSEQLKKIKSNLNDLQKEFSDVNVKLEFEKWQDWMLSKNKTYIKYNSAFRNWLRSDYTTKKETVYRPEV